MAVRQKQIVPGYNARGQLRLGRVLTDPTAAGLVSVHWEDEPEATTLPQVALERLCLVQYALTPPAGLQRAAG